MYNGVTVSTKSLAQHDNRRIAPFVRKIISSRDTPPNAWQSDNCITAVHYPLRQVPIGVGFDNNCTVIAYTYMRITSIFRGKNIVSFYIYEANDCLRIPIDGGY